MVDFANPFGSLLEGFRLGEADYIKAEEAKRRRRAQDLDFYLKASERGFLTDQNTIAFDRELQRMGVAQGYQQDNLNLEYGLRDQNAGAAHARTSERDESLHGYGLEDKFVDAAFQGQIGGAAVADAFSDIYGITDRTVTFGGTTYGNPQTSYTLPIRPDDAPPLTFGDAVTGSPAGAPAAPGGGGTPAGTPTTARPAARTAPEPGAVDNDQMYAAPGALYQGGPLAPSDVGQVEPYSQMHAQAMRGMRPGEDYQYDPDSGVVFRMSERGAHPWFRYPRVGGEIPFDPFVGAERSAQPAPTAEQSPGPLTMTIHPDGAYQTYTSDVGNQVLAQLDAQGVPYQLDMRTGIVWGANNEPLFGFQD